MLLGDKIRKYRLLNDKTQRQLGEEMGFKESTADVRINQYETYKMAPKAEIREKIAHILNIDIASLSDVCPTSYEDFMYVLFEMEDTFGMEIEKKDGRTYLSFDDNERKIRTFITYLNIWKNQKAAIFPDPKAVTSEQDKRYQLWKSRFKSNISEYFKQKEDEINSHYEPLTKEIEKSTPCAKNTSEICLLLRKMLDAGLTIQTTLGDYIYSCYPQGLIFNVNELLSPPSKEAEMIFAQFRAEINNFNSLGAACFIELQMLDENITITYFMPVSSFNVITASLDSVLAFYENRDNMNELMRDIFESTYSDDLKKYSLDIEEEISKEVRINKRERQ